jgi:CheY-like chemotaxis protein
VALTRRQEKFWRNFARRESFLGEDTILSYALSASFFGTFFSFPESYNARAVDMPNPLSIGKFGDNRCVLVVDDEIDICSIVNTVLMQAGFRVVIANDGQIGVERFCEDPEQFALVILDQTMPRLSGPDAAKAMRRLRPDVKILFTSGVDTDFDEAHFLSKPFRVKELLDSIRSIV